MDNQVGIGLIGISRLIQPEDVYTFFDNPPSYPNPTLELPEPFVSAKTSTPLQKLDGTLSNIDSKLGELGAIANRLKSVISNASTTVLNLNESRSRIIDANYAIEVFNMSKNQLLQSVGNSVLVQANTSTNIVLNHPGS